MPFFYHAISARIIQPCTLVKQGIFWFWAFLAIISDIRVTASGMSIVFALLDASIIDLATSPRPNFLNRSNHLIPFMREKKGAFTRVPFGVSFAVHESKLNEILSLLQARLARAARHWQAKGDAIVLHKHSPSLREPLPPPSTFTVARLMKSNLVRRGKIWTRSSYRGRRALCVSAHVEP